MANKSIWGVSMVKDEEDLVFHTLIGLAEEGLDGIIIADNLSTDNTRNEIQKVIDTLQGSDCKIVLVEDNEVGYYQSKKMTALARMAHEEYNATWIIPFDIDEVWYAKGGKISDVINDLSDAVNVICADLYNHFPTSLDPEGIIPFQTIGWRQKEIGALPKVAFKWVEGCVIEQGNHGVSMPYPILYSNCLEVRHFPYRTWQQFKRKAINGAAAYNATNLTQYGEHWRQYAAQIEKWGDEVVEYEVFRKYFYHFSPVDNNMIFDPAPFRRWNKS